MGDDRTDTRSFETSTAERRQHPRVAVDVDCEQRGARDATFATARLKDLSLGGCYVRTSAKREPGEFVHLRLPIGKAVDCLGRVARVGSDGVGVEFVAFDERDLVVLRAFLARR